MKGTMSWKALHQEASPSRINGRLFVGFVYSKQPGWTLVYMQACPLPLLAGQPPMTSVFPCCRIILHHSQCCRTMGKGRGALIWPCMQVYTESRVLNHVPMASLRRTACTADMKLAEQITNKFLCHRSSLLAAATVQMFAHAVKQAK